MIPVELNGDMAHGGFQNYMLCVGRHLTGTGVNREGTKDEREVKQQSELMSTKSFLERFTFRAIERNFAQCFSFLLRYIKELDR